MPSSKSKSEEVNFEQSLEKLEKLVEQLESGELGLDESLQQFEEGVKLYKVCKEKLDSTEKKLNALTDQMKEEPLELKGDQE
jgi:exodeoxyribonuclease VII small subunit